MQGQKRTLISYATGDRKPKLQIAFGQRKISFPGVKISPEQPQSLYSPEYHGRSTDTSRRVSAETSTKLNNKYVDATNQTDYYGVLEWKDSKDARKRKSHYEFNPRKDGRVSKLNFQEFKGREISKIEVNRATKDKRNSKTSQETNGNRKAPESEIFMLKKEETIIIVNEKRRKSKSKFDVSQEFLPSARDGNAQHNGTRESKVINEVGDLKRKIGTKIDSPSVVKKVSTRNFISTRTSTLSQKKRDTSEKLEQKKPSKIDEIKLPAKHKRKSSKTLKASNIDVKNVKEINESNNSKSSHRKSKSRSQVKNTKDARKSKSSEIKQSSSKAKSSIMKTNLEKVKERKSKSKTLSEIGKKDGSKKLTSKNPSKLIKSRRKSKT